MGMGMNGTAQYRFRLQAAQRAHSVAVAQATTLRLLLKTTANTWKTTGAMVVTVALLASLSST